ncbi:MAG: hypothetical protein NTU53_06135 [Planctomycetota bacterium]|nr:hypothetical protein [Planctomycetota bacterium]
MVAHLQQLGLDEADRQGVSVDERAVVISTWHSAKGLEWPMTVLFELGRRDSETVALGVRMVNERQEVQLDNPLGGRLIHYWSKTNGMSRGEVPVGVIRVVAFIDVQATLLYWIVSG